MALKSQHLKPKKLNNTEKLHKAIIQYNDYIMANIKKLEDFDIWYEKVFRADFPIEWYSHINSNKL